MEASKDKDLPAAVELRRNAETQLHSQSPEMHPGRTRNATQRLVHELEVHQIELEMQNAELRQARDEVETALIRYTDLYDSPRSAISPSTTPGTYVQ